MSKKLALLCLGFWVAASLGSCSQAVPDPIDPIGPSIELTETPIQLGVANIANQAATSRAVGNVLTATSQIVGEKIALYGVCQLFGSGDRVWAKANRLIDNTAAQVELDPAKSDYRFNYATDKAYYPAGGFLNVYALYPSNGTYVQITDDNAKAPQAVVTLADRFHKQYDVLHGQTEQLTVAQAQQARVTFGHTLAQLRIKIYRDADATDHPTLTKVVVRGVSKATLASIERATFTNSTNKADSLDFIAYEGSMPLSATTKESALTLNADTALMLFPGLESISTITVTVDGNTFITYVPKTWDLMQGKVNTLTLTLRKFEVRLETPWKTTPWGVGQGANEGIENNGKMIRISGKMIDASGNSKVTYAGAIPTKADIAVLGFTHRGVAIESVAGGVFKTALFNSGSLNDNPLYLEGLTLYDLSNNILFSGILNSGKLSSGATLYIDEANNGLLKKSDATGTTADLVMTFGGFGDGTATTPYEVSTVDHLRNIDKLRGTQNASPAIALNGTPTGGAKFIQTMDIDLAGIAFAGIAQSPFYGIYDGLKHQIKNVTITQQPYCGLFGQVSKAGQIATAVTNVVIAGGTVRNTATSSAYTGAVVGALNGGAVVSHCSNSASVTGATTRVGGLVGQVGGVSQVLYSANFGTVSSNSGSLGGLIGASGNSAAFTLADCYNAGAVVYTGNALTAQVGGLIGSLAMGGATPTLSNCYNRGAVSVASIAGITLNVGSVVGISSGSVGLAAGSKTNYWLTGSYRVGVGVGVLNVATKITEKSETELKGLATTLGGAWKADYTTNPINEGFPILTWQ